MIMMIASNISAGRCQLVFDMLRSIYYLSDTLVYHRDPVNCYCCFSCWNKSGGGKVDEQTYTLVSVRQ